MSDDGWTVVRYGRRHHHNNTRSVQQYSSPNRQNTNRPRYPEHGTRSFTDHRTYAQVAATPPHPENPYQRRTRAPFPKRTRPPIHYRTHTQFTTPLTHTDNSYRQRTQSPTHHRTQPYRNYTEPRHTPTTLRSYPNRFNRPVHPNTQNQKQPSRSGTNPTHTPYQPRPVTTHQKQQSSETYQQKQTRLHTEKEPTRLLSPKDRDIVMTMHNAIILKHHLLNITDGEKTVEPPAITNMTHRLTEFIKPFLPDESTRDLILGNAKNWACTTLLVLRDHYSDTLDKHMSMLLSEDIDDWESLFEIAATKAKQRQGRRLTDHNIQIAKNYIEPFVVDPSDDTSDSSPNPRQEHTTHANTPDNTTTSTHIHDDHLGIPTHTSTPQADDTPSGNLITLDEWNPPAPISPLPPRTNRNTQETDTCNQLVTIPDTNPQHNNTPTSHQTPTPTTLLSTHNTPRQTTLTLTITPHNPNVPQPQHDLPPIKVNRHPTTTLKQKNWTLHIAKPKLIIGDSNLSRITQHNIHNLQIDSYPGASFTHTESLINRATSSTVLQSIVLSFGLNNKATKVKETTIKQIQRTLKLLREKFPGTKIYIPIINYSNRLPYAEQTTLKELNTYIEKNYQFIPPLPTEQFHTEADNIHWTPETARNILKHWTTFLG